MILHIPTETDLYENGFGYLPSQVVLSHPPLVGIMCKSEVESAAALYVCACRFHGDKWQPITIKQLADAIESDVKNEIEPLYSLNTNPFFRPDIKKFIDSEFGEETKLNDVREIRLTKAGFDAIKYRYVLPTGKKLLCL